MKVLVYKFADRSREELEAMFDLQELKQTRVYQEARQEGQAQGIQQEALRLTLRLLHRKLGSLSGGLEEQIRALSVTELEELGEAVLELATESDLQSWLQQIQK
jgi:predicted transposase YdaD